MSGTMTEAPQEGGRLSTWFDKEEVIARFDSMLADTGFGGKDFIARILVSLNTPALEECTMASKFNAAHKCAVLGLFADLQHVALVPKNIKIRKNPDQWEKQVVVTPQWQGYKTLMERDPQVWEVNATLVHVQDKFTVVDGVVKHEYEPFGRSFSGFKDLRGGYVTVTYRDNRHPVKYHFADVEYIKKCAGCAETQAIWDKWFEQMALKTVMRSAWSRRVVNFDPILQRRLIDLDLVDDEAHGNDPTRGVVIEQRPAMGLPSATPKRSEQILERMSHKQNTTGEEKPAPSKKKSQASRQDAPAEAPEGDDGSSSAGEVTNNDAGADEQPKFDEATASKGFKDFVDMFKRSKTMGSLKELLKYVQKDDCPLKLSPAEKTEAMFRIDIAISEME